MRLSGCLVVVPEFIYETVTEAGLSKETMLNVEELATVLNKESVANYVAINEYISQGRFMTGTVDALSDLVAVRDTLTPCELTKNLTTKVAKDISDNALVILNSLNSTDNFSNHSKVIENLLGITPEEVNLKLPNYVYELFYIKDDCFGLRLVPKPEEIHINPTIVIERNLNLLNIHYKYEELVNTELFRRWCTSTLQQF